MTPHIFFLFLRKSFVWHFFFLIFVMFYFIFNYLCFVLQNLGKICMDIPKTQSDDFLPRTHAHSHTRFSAARTSHARVRFAKIRIAHAHARLQHKGNFEANFAFFLYFPGKIKSKIGPFFTQKRAKIAIARRTPGRPHARTSHARFKSLFARTSHTCVRARTCACANLISQLTDWKC